jgi:hypothetical protein
VRRTRPVRAPRVSSSAVGRGACSQAAAGATHQDGVDPADDQPPRTGSRQPGHEPRADEADEEAMDPATASTWVDMRKGVRRAYGHQHDTRQKLTGSDTHRRALVALPREVVGAGARPGFRANRKRATVAAIGCVDRERWNVSVLHRVLKCSRVGFDQRARRYRVRVNAALPAHTPSAPAVDEMGASRLRGRRFCNSRVAIAALGGDARRAVGSGGRLSRACDRLRA